MFKRRTDFYSIPAHSALSRSAFQFDRSTEKKLSRSEDRGRGQRGHKLARIVTLSWSEAAVEERGEPGCRCASDEDESRVLYEETLGSDVLAARGAAQVATMRPSAKAQPPPLPFPSSSSCYTPAKHTIFQERIFFFFFSAFHITEGGMNIALC